MATRLYYHPPPLYTYHGNAVVLPPLLVFVYSTHRSDDHTLLRLYYRPTALVAAEDASTDQDAQDDPHDQHQAGDDDDG